MEIRLNTLIFVAVAMVMVGGALWWINPRAEAPAGGGAPAWAAPQPAPAPPAAAPAPATEVAKTPPAPAATNASTAATSTTAANAPAADNTLKPGEQTRAMVIIEGDYSKGSGFIVKMRGQYFVVTNQHVLSGNTKFTVTGADGTKYPTTGQLFGAVDYDIAILKIPPTPNALELADDPADNIKIGEAVTVPGNEEGEGVVTNTEGHIVGVGPKLVEVDAKFVHGNSGSPIILDRSGQVAGVATYVEVYDLDTLQKAAQKGKTRWFGYRLDNVKEWQELDWARYSAEGVQLRDIESTTDAILDEITSDSPHQVDNDQVNDIVTIYESDVDTAIQHRNREDLLAAVAMLAEHLNTIGDSELKNYAAENLYDYHAREAQEQLAERTQLNQLLQNVGDIFHEAERHAL
jgi:hypothetical protein